MSDYFYWNKTVLEDLSESNISDFFNKGYLFTRESKGSVYQTRSLRINLSAFELSSENRRILNKTSDLTYKIICLPIPLNTYDWNIHKLGKDFYENKLHLEKVFSSNKIKELLTSSKDSNFNCLIEYSVSDKVMGYAICYANGQIFQYAYPFYKYEEFPNNYGMGMMLSAIIYAKEMNLKYIYLGSVTRETDLYKLQFKGLEWFDENSWQTEKIEELKQVIQNFSKI